MWVTTGGLRLHSLKSSTIRQQGLRNSDLYGRILGFVPAAMSELEIYQHSRSLHSSRRLFCFCAYTAATDFNKITCKKGPPPNTRGRRQLSAISLETREGPSSHGGHYNASQREQADGQVQFLCYRRIHCIADKFGLLLRNCCLACATEKCLRVAKTAYIMA